MMMMMMIIIIIINSILIYLSANLTAQRRITELARARRKKQRQNTANKTKAKEFI
jgi:hypothetical protein